jgi:hypothetical protein
LTAQSTREEYGDSSYNYSDTVESKEGRQQSENGKKTFSGGTQHAALRRIRTETEATWKRTPGEKTNKNLLNNGGWQIISLAPSPSRSPIRRQTVGAP